MPKLAAPKYSPPSKYDLLLSTATFFTNHLCKYLDQGKTHYNWLGFASSSIWLTLPTSGHWWLVLFICPHKTMKFITQTVWNTEQFLTHLHLPHFQKWLFFWKPSSASAVSVCVRWLCRPLSMEHGRHFPLIQDRTIIPTLRRLCSLFSTWFLDI